MTCQNKCNECGQDIPDDFLKDEEFIDRLIETVEALPDFMRQGINHHTYDGYWD